jgi:hypothetical protein
MTRTISAGLLLSLFTACASAQTMYRCEEGGSVVFSDKPCPGGKPVAAKPAAGAATPSTTPATAAAAPAAKPRGTPAAPTPSTPAAPSPTKAAAPLGPGYQTREQACAEGSRKACDELACLRDDAEACRRIGGSVRGSGWYEVSRKRETRAGKNDRGQTTLQRVLVLTIKCSGQPPRGGDIAIARGEITLARSTVNYSSVDTAAAALCKR